jgi:CRP/FNR family transcriptional regulator, cyclic AMP receptor protein
MTPTEIDLLGYTAASLVLATFCAKSMVTLRAVALCSNVVFVLYAIEASLWPILLLHAVMFPLNLLRLREAFGTERRFSLALPGGLVPIRVLARRSGRPR